MKRGDVFLCEENTPVRLFDGRLGLLIRYPIDDMTECGVQVPGEEDIRWIPYDSLDEFYGGLIERPSAKA